MVKIFNFFHKIFNFFHKIFNFYHKNFQKEGMKNKVLHKVETYSVQCTYIRGGSRHTQGTYAKEGHKKKKGEALFPLFELKFSQEVSADSDQATQGCVR